jgi:putative tricarboxylic transport membrane protein
VSDASESPTGRVRAPQDLAAGLLLVGVAAFGWWQGRDLPAGTLRQFGPGMVPLALMVMLALCGVLISLGAFRAEGPSLGNWNLRAGIFVLGSAVAFGFAIKPLGFVVAGPVAVILASLAGRDGRFLEAIVFGIVMTAICVALFRYALGLPIPVAPWWIGY